MGCEMGGFGEIAIGTLKHMVSTRSAEVPPQSNILLQVPPAYRQSLLR